MTTLHVYFTLRNQQAFQRLLDVSRTTNTQTNPGSVLSSSGGRSWNKPSPLAAANVSAASCDVNARDRFGRTVLHLAVSSLDPAALEFVKLLLSHPRTDVNIADLESRWTPLHRALYVGNLPACVLLLQRQDIDVSLKDFEGYTAFDVYNSTVEGTKPSESEATDLFTWGTNRNAALGVGDGNDRAFPEMVPIPTQKEHPNPRKLSLRVRFQPVRARQVAMAKLHMAVVTSERQANIRVCGFGSGGRLGAGAAQHTQYALTPLKDLASETEIVAVALGQDHTLALTNAGSVLSWGLGRFSQLGYALDGGQTLQAAPRRVVGPLKKEVVVGIAACRTASACWTDSELFTWGTNAGQLGYDRAGTPVQVLPRRVTQTTLRVIDVAMSDAAMAVLLASRDVQCFHNGRNFKINFPTQNFPSEIQVYRPPMAQNNASIAKVVSCDNTFAALSSNGEVFTFSLNPSPSTPGADASMTPNKNAAAISVKPQRVWSLRKQFSAVKDVALGSEGTILLCTESGHVYLRSRTNKTSKYTRIPLLQRVVAVAASSAGAFAALKAECTPAPVYIEGNSVSEDLGLIQPYFVTTDVEEWRVESACISPGELTPPSSGDTTATQQSRSDGTAEDAEDALEDALIKKDIEMIFGLLDVVRVTRDALHRKPERHDIVEAVKAKHGADLVVKVDSDFEFPAHRTILAARSETLRDVLLGWPPVKDSGGRIRLQLNKSSEDSSMPIVNFSGVHPLSVLMLTVYLYTDKMPAIWDRRISLPIGDRLANCFPKTSVASVRSDLQKLAAVLHLPALSDSLNTPVKRAPSVCLASDLKMLYDSVQHDAVNELGSGFAHPLAADTILELADAHVYCHSVILRARSPFFASFFDDPDWTIKRRQPNRPLTVNLRHMRLRTMEFVMQFIYCGGNDELFDVLELAETADDALEFLFEIMDVAGELLLDRLLHICASVVLHFLNINNACSILSDASHFNAGQLSNSVQGYMARNMETLLESRMLDDLPMHLIRRLASFVCERQLEKSPITRSGKIVDAALEKWRDWLALQDLPQPTIPGRKVSTNQIRHTPSLSPQMASATAKRNRRPSIGAIVASYSPPPGYRLLSTPPSGPVQKAQEDAPDDIFEMDDVQEALPPLSLPNAGANGGPSASRTDPPAASETFSPWKARVSQPAPRVDFRSIIAEAEGKKTSTSPSTTPPGRPRIVGFDMPIAGPSTSSLRTPQKAEIGKGVTLAKPGLDSPWRTPKITAVPGRGSPPVTNSPVLTRKPSETQQGTPSGLSHDLREHQASGSRPSPAASSAVQAGQPVLGGKGKAPLGPTFTPIRQAVVAAAVPISRRTSEGKSWAAVPAAFNEPAQPIVTSSSTTPPSFLAIQRQQREQNSSPSRPRKSLLEIQKEEEARAVEERATREEIEFMQWWAAEEERIRRETQAQPGPPVHGPAGGPRRGGKRAKGVRKVGTSIKKQVAGAAPTSGQAEAEDENKGAVTQGIVNGQKAGRARRGRPKAANT